MSTSQIHPQLLADCHLLAEFPETTVLLHRNAVVPWLILVPKTELEDLLELPLDQLQGVMAEAKLVSEFMKNYWKLKKLNFAQLGNVVPQMHLHLVGRDSKDNCWPKPVWGNLTETGSYAESEVESIAQSLRGKVFGE